MSTLIVNFFGGPGSGKSTMCANVFSELKWNNVNCEITTEYAKELCWEETTATLDNQIYVFAQQHHRIFRLLNKVQVILTDSPIILSCVYDSSKNQYLRDLVLTEYNKWNCYDIFLERKKNYNPSGRVQKTIEEASKIDTKILDFMIDNEIPYQSLPGEKESVDKIVKNILHHLDKSF